MKKIYIIITLFAFFSSSYGQTIDAGIDQLVCPGECADISAALTGGGETTDYVITDIPFTPEPYAGTPVTLFDDDLTGLLPIGFDFCFYGNVYSEFVICSNNWIGFSPGETSTWVTQPIPGTALDRPKNCIMGPWHDINPSAGGTIQYQTLGVAPFRRLVVTYESVPMFSCDDDIFTSQIVIYETTNIIENHIDSKPICATWNDGRGVQGIHNSDGTEAVVYAGRNNTAWAVTNESIRYTPDGAPMAEWYEGGVLIASGADVTVCPAATTTYTVNLVSCGGTIVATDDVTVEVTPLLSIDAGEDQMICQGEEITLVGTGAGMGGTYTWTGGVTDGMTFEPTVTTTYTLTGTDVNGCSNTDMITITVNPLPVVDAGADFAVCDGESVTLSGMGIGVGGTYTWDGGVADGIGFTPEITTTYMVTGTDANGCVDTDDILITINPLPEVSFVGDELIGCAPFLINFSNTTVNGNTYQWDFGDGTISNVVSPNHTFLNDGVYDVGLTATSLDGCVSSETYENYITIVPNPIADFIFAPQDIDFSDPEAFFQNGSEFSDSYEWDFGDGSALSNEFEPTHTFPEIAGITYTVSLTARNSIGCENIIERAIFIKDILIYYVPNSFTPDGDDFNEEFKPVFTTGFDPFDYHFTVFNRFGEIVFESFNAQAGWDGTYGDRGVITDGVYVWRVVFGDASSDEIHSDQGHVTIIR